MERPYQTYASSSTTSPLVKVFTWMAVALAVTAVMALVVFFALSSGLISESLYGSLMIGSIVTLIISYIWFAAYGSTTKTSLLGLGQFAFVAMLGLIMLSIVNLFIGSVQMDWFISFGIFGVVLLIVAYQVWFVKQITAAGEITNAEAMYLAFSLYISFINIFLRILRFLAASRSGGRR